MSELECRRYLTFHPWIDSETGEPAAGLILHETQHPLPVGWMPDHGCSCTTLVVFILQEENFGNVMLLIQQCFDGARQMVEAAAETE